MIILYHLPQIRTRIGLRFPKKERTEMQGIETLQRSQIVAYQVQLVQQQGLGVRLMQQWI